MSIVIKNIIKDLPYNSNPKMKWNKRAISKISKIVVHQELADGTIESVNRYHITPAPDNHLDKNGAPHICYHFAIRKNGEICQCNELDDITWHVKGYNTVGVGIMLQGDFDAKAAKHKGKNKKPTKEQIDSLKKLLDYLVNELLSRLEKKDVYGHLELQVSKKVCPGDDVMKFIREYRNEKV